MTNIVLQGTARYGDGFSTFLRSEFGIMGRVVGAGLVQL
jgi:hypothetical protein